MRAWIGKSVIGIGSIHTVFGLVAFRQIVGTLAGEWLINTVNGELDRERAFWFLFTGFAWLILGALINWLEIHRETLPAFLGWSFLVMTALGVLVMPVSGFWLFWAPTAGLLQRRRRGKTE